MAMPRIGYDPENTSHRPDLERVTPSYNTLFQLKLKGASSRCTNARKLKGEEKMPRMNIVANS